ncbi:ABC transporter permease [Bordetella sp. BOR01]|uniref:ABC transporter permease n=1 Tax=Bordetella sp. BOR01 TaxID=2854779 RepID=UPI001C48248F|nr:ABC transporter permease [Bordetella sp. BOR01]MBV7483157.1 ABC transporter permease [Bordetella sp. BOR01]
MNEPRRHTGLHLPGWLGRLLSNPLGLAGSLLMLALVVLIVFGPSLAPYDPEAFHITKRLSGPTSDFWLGTDNFGRDILSRLLHGARPTILFGIAATALGTTIGAPIGLIAGFIGGRTDSAIMRAVDVVMAVPNLILILLIVTVLGASTTNAIVAVALTFAPGLARITRSAVLSVREREFVQACVARGESARYIMFREILPVVVAPILIEASIRVGLAIMLGATLSYLGLGAQPPASDWGLLIANAREFIFRNPWLVFWPSVAIVLATIGFNMFGDGLRDAMNVRAAR